jgi:hypothetical protein
MGGVSLLQQYFRQQEQQQGAYRYMPAHSKASPGAAMMLLLLLLELLAKLLNEDGAPLCVSEVTVMASGHRAGIVPAKFVPALPAGGSSSAAGVSKL